MFLTKNALFGYFFARIKKKVLSYLKSPPSNLSIANLAKKRKCLNLGPKRCYLGNLDPKFENNVGIFKVSILEFV